MASAEVAPPAPRAERLVPWLYLAPAGLFILVLITAALVILRISFGEKGAEWTGWSLDGYRAIFSSLYLRSIVLTFRLSLVCTLATIILAYPIAMVLASARSAQMRRLLLICLLMPLVMNLVLQSYGWLVLLAPNGIVNNALGGLGLIDLPVLFLFSERGVALGMVQTALPLAVLPLANAIARIPRSLEDAAAILGAGRLRVLWEVVLPLSKPGLVAAALLVFAFNVSAFVVPFLLGGRRVSMLAVLIRDQMGPLLNWPLGAANSVVLVVVSLVVLGFYLQSTRREPAR